MDDSIYICFPGEYTIFISTSNKDNKHIKNNDDINDGNLCIVHSIYKDKIKLINILEPSKVILADSIDLIESGEYGGENCDDSDELNSIYFKYLSNPNHINSTNYSKHNTRTNNNYKHDDITIDYKISNSNPSNVDNMIDYKLNYKNAMICFYNLEYQKCIDYLLPIIYSIKHIKIIVDMTKYVMICYLKLMNYNEMLAILMKGIQLQTNDNILITYISYTYFLLNQKELAFQSIHEAIKIDNYSMISHYYLGYMYYLHNDYTKCYQEFLICCNDCRGFDHGIDITIIMNIYIDIANILLTIKIDYLLALKALLRCINIARENSFLDDNNTTNTNMNNKINSRLIKKIVCEGFYLIGKVLESIRLSNNNTIDYNTINNCNHLSKDITYKYGYLYGALTAYYLCNKYNIDRSSIYVEAYQRIHQLLYC